jgi:hypothetical protein
VGVRGVYEITVVFFTGDTFDVDDVFFAVNLSDFTVTVFVGTTNDLDLIVFADR